MDTGDADHLLLGVEHVDVVSGRGAPGLERLRGGLVSCGQVLGSVGVRVVVTGEGHAVSWLKVYGEVGATQGLLSKEVITSHVFVVPLGGDGEGIRENQGGKPVVLMILVDASEEIQPRCRRRSFGLGRSLRGCSKRTPA